MDPNGAIFERMIIILPYRAKEQVQAIQSAFERINLKGLNLENARYLNTKELSQEDRNNRMLNFLGGFEIIDSEMRMFVFEGLGGSGNAMHELYLANERARPNDKKFKMLYNPDIRFKNRIYLDFECAIKKIKLRDVLSKIMASPDIYLRSKVPQDMFDTIQKFAEIRKQDRANLVRDFNLYPETKNLLTLERKYGDSLSYEDLNGMKQKKKRRIKAPGSETTFHGTEMISDSRTDGQTVFSGSANETALSKSQRPNSQGGMSSASSSDEEGVVYQRDTMKRKASTDHLNPAFAATLRQRQDEHKDFMDTNKILVKSMCTGRPSKARIELPNDVETYGYSSQKLNIWEFQKEQLRKHISQDRSNFYTYSKDHMSGAFPLVNEHEIAVKAKIANETAWKTKAGFNMPKKENLNEHPKKPPTSV